VTGHWSEKYLGLPWRADRDCYHLFRTIQAAEFGRRVPGADIDHDRLTASAARTMAGDIQRRFGWSPTSAPADGDAVFMSQRRRPHHIGTVAMIGRLHVVHSLEGVGVVISDLTTLGLNGWRIAGYYTHDS
jgi:hypothetical protein